MKNISNCNNIKNDVSSGKKLNLEISIDIFTVELLTSSSARNKKYMWKDVLMAIQGLAAFIADEVLSLSLSLFHRFYSLWLLLF